MFCLFFSASCVKLWEKKGCRGWWEWEMPKGELIRFEAGLFLLAIRQSFSLAIVGFVFRCSDEKARFYLCAVLVAVRGPRNWRGLDCTGSECYYECEASGYSVLEILL